MISSFSRNDNPKNCRTVVSSVLALAAALISGCASSVSTPPAQPGTTIVTVLATSTANDQLSRFIVYFDALTLTDNSGKTVNLLPGFQHEEFIHLNGRAEPMFTINLPQGTYISATATIGPASFECFSGNPSGASTASDFSYGYTPASHVAVALPNPIEVTGDSMALSLNLLVSNSASWSGSPCVAPANSPFEISPTFNLLVASAPQFSMTSLQATVASVNPAAGTLMAVSANGQQQEVTSTGSTVTSNGIDWKVVANSGTQFQGVSSPSALAIGTPVDIDANLQADGSLIATRIAVYDVVNANKTSLSNSIGPIISVDDDPLWLQNSNSTVLLAADTETGGNYAATLGGWAGSAGFALPGARFQISGQFSNLQHLPFPAKFDATNAAAGQMIFFTFEGNDLSNSLPVNTVTLMPQTINGVVTTVSTDGGFDTYRVSLMPYDLFPELAVLKFQTTVLTDPYTVVVYADSSTQMLNSQPIVIGSLLRFNGLIFNDSGTLRMDCAQINDGVNETK